MTTGCKLNVNTRKTIIINSSGLPYTDKQSRFEEFLHNGHTDEFYC